MKLTAFTQIIVTLAVTAWVFILPVEAVATILVLELALLLYIKHDKMTMAAIGGLAVFTGMMILLQLLFGSPLDVSLIGGLRMLVMTMAFLCLLAASRIQDIAKALVDRFHMPCEYAFMLTTALRFVPNFLTDSGITLDAQSCRGYSNRGNMFKRFFAYLVVIRPLVMRAVAKSETLALSMELKGFGGNTYKNMPPLPVDSEGFRSVGDMGYVDADGYLYFADRRSDMIVTGGENVFAAEVEMVLKKHPKVVDAVVIGLPDPDWGHRIHAIVETNAPLGSKELIRFALNYLPPYKIPKSIEFTDHIPVNENGKIVRSKLIEESLAKGY